MNFDKKAWKERILQLEQDQETWVHYSDEQIARGEVGNPEKGLRPWSVPRSTGQFLYDLVQKMGAEHVLELGTSIGYSTLWLGAALSEQNGKLTTIEHEPRKSVYAKEQARICGLDSTITFHEGEILDFLQTNPGTWDLVFFDADKGQYHLYFPLVLDQLAANGICVFDNIDTHPQKFTKLFELFKTIPELSYLHITYDNGLLLVTRNHVKFPRIAFNA